MNKLVILGVAALMLMVAPVNAEADCTDASAEPVGALWIADGGDWIYAESGEADGLQRGGDRVAVDAAIGHSGEGANYAHCDSANFDTLIY